MIILYLILYAAGAWFSQRHAAEYFWVGPVFGCVVVIWGSKSLKDLLSWKNALFIALSTLIYAVVYHVAKQNWSGDSALLESLLGPLPTGVLAGSLLLPLAHCLVLGSPRSKAFLASPALMASFYFVTFMANTADALNRGANWDFIGIAVFLWQGIYLSVFFYDRLRGSAKPRSAG